MKCVNKPLIWYNMKMYTHNKIEQDYGTRSYFKLVLYRLKVMGGPTTIYTPLGPSSKKFWWLGPATLLGVAHAPLNHYFILIIFLEYF